MYESTTQRNKAIWVGSLALLTVGSVLYFTMLRKPEDSSKPAKDTKTREVVKERPANTTQAGDKETVKDDIPQLGDVPQAKATGTLEKEVTEITSVIPTESTPTQQDDTDTEVVVAISTTIDTTTTTIDADNHSNTSTELDDEKTSTQQDIEKDVGLEDEEEEEEEEKSPLLTAAPSSSSSSDIDSSALSEQQHETAKVTASPTDNLNNNHNTANGADLNGYWQPPATTATFQHSMGWPELFPLQQHQQQQQQQQPENDEIKRAPVPVTLDTPVDPVVSVPTGEKKKHNKKRMTRLEQIEQQRQNYVPPMKARCNWWPSCSNKNCKYRHPTQPCRYGDMCVYNERCMFLHPWDCEEPVRHTKQTQHTDNLE
ncbi:hypothetical protein BC941DRAFT_513857 [Chlamydoabsidia padenii]|nr:hypothetical protein BC941DRAFT_513857 [Chlamydoabsidia padenii]